MHRSLSSATHGLAAAFALGGLLAVAGCSPEGKGQVKLNSRSTAEFGPAQPPKQESETRAGKEPPVRSIKSRGQAEAQ